MPSQAYLLLSRQDPHLPPPRPDPGLLSPSQILHLKHQMSLRDELLQLFSDSDEEEEEEEEKKKEEEEEEEKKRRKRKKRRGSSAVVSMKPLSCECLDFAPGRPLL